MNVEEQIEHPFENAGWIDQERSEIDELTARAWSLRNSDRESGFNLAIEAQQRSTSGVFAEQHHLPGFAASALMLGVCEFRRSDYSAALRHALNALEIYNSIRDQQGQARTYNLLGMIFVDLGDYETAFEYDLQARRLANAVDERDIEASALNEIGLVYLYTHEYEQAIEEFQKSLLLYHEIGDHKGEADIFDNSSKAYVGLKQYDKALQFAFSGLRLYQQIGNRQGQAEALESIGTVYHESGEYPQAENYLKQSLWLFRDVGNTFGETNVLLKLGDVYFALNNTETAVDYLEQALTVAQHVQLTREQYLTHERLATVYKQHGDFERALSHYQRFNELQTHVFNERADIRRKSLQVAYEVESARHETEIYQLKTVALKREIRDRRSAEKALKEANRQLQDEISAREQLIDELNAFSHTVAHDLRNPLILITNYSDFLASEFKDVLPDNAREWLQTIKATSYKMDRIIEELLILAGVREQTIVPQPLDMAAIIGEAVARLTVSIDENNAEIVAPETFPTALGYAPWVEEVWVNYLSNALKYGGKPPQIEVGAEQLPGGMVRFWVRDNGDGISAEAREQLFVPFTRLNQVKAKGDGLGLSIVRRIVEKLNGTVGVESDHQPGAGSLFYFTLPAAE